MSGTMTSDAVGEYEAVLADYLRTHTEEALYHAGLLSQRFIESGLGPEDIIVVHLDALERVVSVLPRRAQTQAGIDGYQFLLEVMIAYGVKYKEYLELKLAQTLREAEARAQEAERAQREKDDLLGMIAHELRTPLTAAKGSIDLAIHGLSRGQADALPRHLDRARAAIDRLTRLSADLIDASRGLQSDLDLTPQDLTAILTQACSWVQTAAAAKGIALLYEPPEEGMAVVANADALLSVFGNLLSNAVRYTPAGGRIGVTQRREGDSFSVAVADTGIGMTPQTRQQIFKKFYRGEEARRVEAGGLGLGLALVQQIVEAHGGHVEVTSELGQGSTFRVVLRASSGDDGAG